MFETHLTVVGTVITDPLVRKTGSGDVVSFRVASNSRKFDAEKNEWNNDKVLYLGVSCWRKLAAGVAASVQKGNPIIVSGTVRTNEYTVGDEKRSSLEMDAKAVGLDLSRCIVKFCGYPRRDEDGHVDEQDSAAPVEDAAPTEAVGEIEAIEVDDEINGVAAREEAPAF
ncbi:MAG: single-stranded DNA-binding protein [Gordonia sp. (in: high G+C Gram-positive bacteria)]|uniref:single-stranded DNA-binding protein n=1 Tax=Gordonia sp. (in: high G+C Gram-positive bacteria) TaxID=84139 RepID=UPI0039E3008F